MLHIRFIDVEVSLPSDVVATARPPRDCVMFYRLEGQSVEKVRLQIEKIALALGYDLKRTDRASYLVRREREQRIVVLVTSATRLDVTVDDQEQLPLARVTERGIALGRFVIELEAVRVVSGRERHTPNSTQWIGEWKVFGKDAREVSSMALDALVATGLHSSGTFAPTTPGIGGIWTSESYNPDTLMKIRAKQESDHVLLQLELIDNLVKSSVGGDRD